VAEGGTHKLAALQDIDLMIRERKKEEELGFSTAGIENLEKARAKLVKSVSPRDLRNYDRLSRRYDRAVSPVIGNSCLACSMAVPTSKRREGEDRRTQTLVTCESCGRILFFV
jgi:predicted  nucleic acid-binding Zn-ribbon protein